MNSSLSPMTRTDRSLRRQVEGEGILRVLLLAAAVAMPLGTLAYLQIQKTRLSYEMSEVRSRIKQEEEFQRKLLLERSRNRVADGGPRLSDRGRDSRQERPA